MERSFPFLPGPRPTYHNPFRQNITEFLATYGNRVPLKLQLTTAWIVPLKHKGGAVKLHVYEEHLDEASGAPPTCDQCRNMGWQHHPVSKQRYHFILPSPAVLADPDQLPSLVEAAAAGRVDPEKAAVNNLSVEVKDSKDCYNAPASIFDSTTHCLHGVIHSNGFGHLLRMNGRDGAAATAAALAAAAADQSSDEAIAAAAVAAAATAAASASSALAGPELMSLWDALCSTLRAREVSVEDVSNKASMLLRLLYNAAHMCTWYGKWGYTFGRAAFNYGADEYAAAVRAIHSAPLAALMRDIEIVDATALKILRTYQSLPPSLPADATFGQLLQRMLFFISRPDVLKDARVLHIAAAKAAAAAKASAATGAPDGAAAAVAGGPEAPAQEGVPGAGSTVAAATPSGGMGVGGAVVSGVGGGGPGLPPLPPAAGGPGRKGGKGPLSSAGLPPAKRGRRSAGSEDPSSGTPVASNPAAPSPGLAPAGLPSPSQQHAGSASGLAPLPPLTLPPGSAPADAPAPPALPSPAPLPGAPLPASWTGMMTSPLSFAPPLGTQPAGPGPQGLGALGPAGAVRPQLLPAAPGVPSPSPAAIAAAAAAAAAAALATAAQAISSITAAGGTLPPFMSLLTQQAAGVLQKVQQSQLLPQLQSPRPLLPLTPAPVPPGGQPPSQAAVPAQASQPQVSAQPPQPQQHQPLQPQFQFAPQPAAQLPPSGPQPPAQPVLQQAATGPVPPGAPANLLNALQPIPPPAPPSQLPQGSLPVDFPTLNTGLLPAGAAPLGAQPPPTGPVSLPPLPPPPQQQGNGVVASHSIAPLPSPSPPPQLFQAPDVAHSPPPPGPQAVGSSIPGHAAASPAQAPAPVQPQQQAQAQAQQPWLLGLQLPPPPPLQLQQPSQTPSTAPPPEPSQPSLSSLPPPPPHDQQRPATLSEQQPLSPEAAAALQQLALLLQEPALPQEPALTQPAPVPQTLHPEPQPQGQPAVADRPPAPAQEQGQGQGSASSWPQAAGPAAPQGGGQEQAGAGGWSLAPLPLPPEQLPAQPQAPPQLPPQSGPQPPLPEAHAAPQQPASQSVGHAQGAAGAPSAAYAAPQLRAAGSGQLPQPAHSSYSAQTEPIKPPLPSLLPPPPLLGAQCSAQPASDAPHLQQPHAPGGGAFPMPLGGLTHQSAGPAVEGATALTDMPGPCPSDADADTAMADGEAGARPSEAGDAVVELGDRGSKRHKPNGRQQPGLVGVAAAPVAGGSTGGVAAPAASQIGEQAYANVCGTSAAAPAAQGMGPGPAAGALPATAGMGTAAATESTAPGPGAPVGSFLHPTPAGQQAPFSHPVPVAPSPSLQYPAPVATAAAPLATVSEATPPLDAAAWAPSLAAQAASPPVVVETGESPSPPPFAAALAAAAAPQDFGAAAAPLPPPPAAPLYEARPARPPSPLLTLPPLLSLPTLMDASELALEWDLMPEEEEDWKGPAPTAQPAAQPQAAGAGMPPAAAAPPPTETQAAPAEVKATPAEAKQQLVQEELVKVEPIEDAAWRGRTAAEAPCGADAVRALAGAASGPALHAMLPGLQQLELKQEVQLLPDKEQPQQALEAPEAIATAGTGEPPGSPSGEATPMDVDGGGIGAACGQAEAEAVMPVHGGGSAANAALTPLPGSLQAAHDASADRDVSPAASEPTAMSVGAAAAAPVAASNAPAPLVDGSDGGEGGCEHHMSVEGTPEAVARDDSLFGGSGGGFGSAPMDITPTHSPGVGTGPDEHAPPPPPPPERDIASSPADTGSKGMAEEGPHCHGVAAPLTEEGSPSGHGSGLAPGDVLPGIDAEASEAKEAVPGGDVGVHIEAPGEAPVDGVAGAALAASAALAGGGPAAAPLAAGAAGADLGTAAAGGDLLVALDPCGLRAPAGENDVAGSSGDAAGQAGAAAPPGAAAALSAAAEAPETVVLQEPAALGPDAAAPREVVNQPESATPLALALPEAAFELHTDAPQSNAAAAGPSSALGPTPHADAGLGAAGGAARDGSACEGLGGARFAISDMVTPGARAPDAVTALEAAAAWQGLPGGALGAVALPPVERAGYDGSAAPAPVPATSDAAEATQATEAPGAGAAQPVEQPRLPSPAPGVPNHVPAAGTEAALGGGGAPGLGSAAALAGAEPGCAPALEASMGLMAAEGLVAEPTVVMASAAGVAGSVVEAEALFPDAGVAVLEYGSAEQGADAAAFALPLSIHGIPDVSHGLAEAPVHGVMAAPGALPAAEAPGGSLPALGAGTAGFATAGACGDSVSTHGAHRNGDGMPGSFEATPQLMQGRLDAVVPPTAAAAGEGYASHATQEVGGPSTAGLSAAAGYAACGSLMDWSSGGSAGTAEAMPAQLGLPLRSPPPAPPLPLPPLLGEGAAAMPGVVEGGIAHACADHEVGAVPDGSGGGEQGEAQAPAALPGKKPKGGRRPSIQRSGSAAAIGGGGGVGVGAAGGSGQGQDAGGGAAAGPGAGGATGGGTGGRARGPVKASGAHIGPAPDDLPKEPISELRELHAEAEADMHLRDCQRAMDAMLRALQSHCNYQWLARLALRDVMMEYYRDYKVLDWVLKQVANVRIGGYAVYRSKYSVTRSYYYRLERLPDTPPDAPLEYTVPMPAHGPYARKGGRLIKPRSAKPGAAATHGSAASAGAASAAASAAGDGDGDGGDDATGADGGGDAAPVDGEPEAGKPEKAEAGEADGKIGAADGADSEGTHDDLPLAALAARAAPARRGHRRSASAAKAATDADAHGPARSGKLGAAVVPAGQKANAGPEVAELAAAAADAGEGGLGAGAAQGGGDAAAAASVKHEAPSEAGPATRQDAGTGEAADAEAAKAAEERRRSGAEAGPRGSTGSLGGAANGSVPGTKLAAAGKVGKAGKQPAPGSASVGSAAHGKPPQGARKGAKVPGRSPTKLRGAAAAAVAAAAKRAAALKGNSRTSSGAAAATGPAIAAAPAALPSGSAAAAAAAGGTSAASTGSDGPAAQPLPAPPPRPAPAGAASWRGLAREHQSEGQALLDSVLESRIEQKLVGGAGGRVPRELRYLMSQKTLSKLKQQQQQNGSAAAPKGKSGAASSTGKADGVKTEAEADAAGSGPAGPADADTDVAAPAVGAIAGELELGIKAEEAKVEAAAGRSPGALAAAPAHDGQPGAEAAAAADGASPAANAPSVLVPDARQVAPAPRATDAGAQGVKSEREQADVGHERQPGGSVAPGQGAALVKQEDLGPEDRPRSDAREVRAEPEGHGGPLGRGRRRRTAPQRAASHAGVAGQHSGAEVDQDASAADTAGARIGGGGGSGIFAEPSVAVKEEEHGPAASAGAAADASAPMDAAAAAGRPGASPPQQQRPQRARVATKAALQAAESLTQRRRRGPKPKAEDVSEREDEEEAQVAIPEGLTITKKPRSARKAPRPSAAANAAVAAIIAFALRDDSAPAAKTASKVSAAAAGTGAGSSGEASGDAGTKPAGKAPGKRRGAAAAGDAGDGATASTPVPATRDASTAAAPAAAPAKVVAAKGAKAVSAGKPSGKPVSERLTSKSVPAAAAPPSAAAKAPPAAPSLQLLAHPAAGGVPKGPRSPSAAVAAAKAADAAAAATAATGGPAATLHARTRPPRQSLLAASHSHATPPPAGATAPAEAALQPPHPGSPNASVRIRLGKVAHPAALSPPLGVGRNLPAPTLPPTTSEAAAAAAAASSNGERASVPAAWPGPVVHDAGGRSAASAGADASEATAGGVAGKRKARAEAQRSACQSRSQEGAAGSMTLQNGKRQKVTHSAATVSNTAGAGTVSTAAGRPAEAAAAAADTASSAAHAAYGRRAKRALSPSAGQPAAGAATAPLPPPNGGPRGAVNHMVDEPAPLGVVGATGSFKPSKGPRGRRSAPAAIEATANGVLPQPPSLLAAAASGDASAPLLPLDESQIVPSPAASVSSAVAEALGPAASQEPYASCLRHLPLTYVHKVVSATGGAAPPPDLSGTAGAGGGRRGRPGSLALWVSGAAAGGGTSGTSFDPKPPPPTNPYVLPGKAHHNTSLTYINDQTQCDLQYLYCSILRTYKPALAVAAALTAKRQTTLRPTALPYMAAAVQMLKDTKYFLKDYGGGTAAAAVAASAADGKVRFLVALQLDAEPSPEAQQRQRPAGRGGNKQCSAAAAAAAAEASVAATASLAPPPRVRRQLTLTPPEVVVVEPSAQQAEAAGEEAGTVVTVGDFKRAVVAAFTETYRMCCPRRGPGKNGGGCMVVTSVVQGFDPQVFEAGDAAPLPALTLAPPSASDAERGDGDGAAAAHPGAQAVPQLELQHQQQPALVVVRCSGLDLDLRWRHAGGPEDWRVACLCGTQDDDGERMIACEVCGVWSHTRCNDIPDEVDEPPSFTCRACALAAATKAGASDSK